MTFTLINRRVIIRPIPIKIKLKVSTTGDTRDERQGVLSLQTRVHANVCVRGTEATDLVDGGC